MTDKPLASIKSLDHFELGEEPAGWKAEEFYHYVLDVDKDSKGRLVFKYIKRPPPSSSKPIPVSTHPKKTKQLDLHVEKNCVIRIELSDKTAWRWQPEKAITTGEDHRSKYFWLEASGQTPSQGSTGLPARVVTFGAAVDGSNPSNPACPFNLNIELEYDDGKILPITVDPDIRNPGTIP